MATVRITTRSVGYPNIAPNSILVLQSLYNAGYKIVLRNTFYKDKPSIIEYFQDHNIHISFMNVHNPDIEISKDSAYVGSTKIQSNKKDLWEDIDQYCVSNKIYDRNYISDYIPSYKNNTFFLVVDYGLSSQLFDSKPMTMSVAHKKGMSIAKELPSIKSIDVVNSTTLQVVEHFNMELQEFEPATEEVFLNVML